MAITSNSSNAETKATKKAMIKNLAWIGVYLAFLFLAGVEFKQRYDWFHTWWYLFISSDCGTFVIFIICRGLRKYYGDYSEEKHNQYIKLYVLSRAAFSASIALLVYSALVITFELKILGTAFTIATLIVLSLKFVSYLKLAYGLKDGLFDFLGGERGFRRR